MLGMFSRANLRAIPRVLPHGVVASWAFPLHVFLLSCTCVSLALPAALGAPPPPLFAIPRLHETRHLAARENTESRTLLRSGLGSTAVLPPCTERSSICLAGVECTLRPPTKGCGCSLYV
eukprot:4628011-Prymnesium_polylepis.1